MSPLLLSVIVCTHNPRGDYLARTLRGLCAQTLSEANWELIVIDNASVPPLSSKSLEGCPANTRLLAEPRIGLTSARLRGIAEARGHILVFVDDDNVLDTDYLTAASKHFSSRPNLAAAGGQVRAEFEAIPPPWSYEFHGLLAVHGHGEASLVVNGGPLAPWPDFAPTGGGMCIRSEHAQAYAAALAHQPERAALDRRAGELTSGGDNDMVFTALNAGGAVGYFPDLSLTHLIPSVRLEREYLARLNEGIQRTWVRVLTLHGRNPWPAIPQWTIRLRSARAWLRTRAWRSPANYIRWRGLHGRFLGQADIWSLRR